MFSVDAVRTLLLGLAALLIIVVGIRIISRSNRADLDEVARTSANASSGSSSSPSAPAPSLQWPDVKCTSSAFQEGAAYNRHEHRAPSRSRQWRERLSGLIDGRDGSETFREGNRSTTVCDFACTPGPPSTLESPMRTVPQVPVGTRERCWGAPAPLSSSSPVRPDSPPAGWTSKGLRQDRSMPDHQYESLREHRESHHPSSRAGRCASVCTERVRERSDPSMLNVDAVRRSCWGWPPC